MQDRLKEALETTGFPFAKYGWSEGPKSETWGVYSAENGRDLAADNMHVESATWFVVDLYTRESGPLPRRRVEAALNGLRCAWRLSSVDYENDTGYIHFKWRCALRGIW